VVHCCFVGGSDVFAGVVEGGTWCYILLLSKKMAPLLPLLALALLPATLLDAGKGHGGWCRQASVAP